MAQAYAREQFEQLSVTSPDLEKGGVELLRVYTSEHNGVTHAFFRQKLDGLGVFGTSVNINVDRDGNIINVGSRLFSQAAESRNALEPTLSAQEVLSRLAEANGIPKRSQSLEVLEVEEGVSRRQKLSLPELADGPVLAELKLLPVAKGDLRLGWSLKLTLKDSRDAFEVLLDALDGTELQRVTRMVRAIPQYQVFPFAVQSPDKGSEATVSEPTDPATKAASPESAYL